jgi:hypothetical protein
MLISILTPSRGRPNSFKQMLDSAIFTSSGKNKLEFCIRLDNDDLTVNRYLFNNHFLKVLISNPSFPNMTKSWEDCYNMATGDIIMIANDDIVFETENWDLIIEEEFKENKLKLVYGKDGIQNEHLATFPFLSREWCSILGYCVQPIEFTFYHDTWLNDIADMVGVKKYREDLIFTHRHKNEENKERHDEMFAYYHGDQKRFNDLLYLRQIGAEKLRSAL